MSFATFSKRHKTNKGKEDYYTKKKIVNTIVDELILPLIEEEKITHFVDFSTGDGFLLKLLTEKKPCLKVIGIDKYPPKKTYLDIICNDFLEMTQQSLTLPKKKVLFGFNPPFGQQGKLAIQFLQHSLTEFKPDFIISILPWSALFHKYTGAKLIGKIELPPSSFYRPASGESFSYKTYLGLFERSLSNESETVFLDSPLVAPSWISSIRTFKSALPFTKNCLLIRRIGTSCGRNGWFKHDKVYIEFRLGKFTGVTRVKRPLVLDETHLIVYLCDNVSKKRINNFIKNLCTYQHQNKHKRTISAYDVISSANLS